MYRGYKCLVPSTGKIIVSRHVVLDEHVFPFSQPAPASPQPDSSQADTTYLPFPITHQLGPHTNTSSTLIPDHATISSPPALSDLPFASYLPSSSTVCSSPSTAHDPPTLAVAVEASAARSHQMRTQSQNRQA